METQLTRRPHTGLAGVANLRKGSSQVPSSYAPLALYLLGEVPALNPGSRTLIPNSLVHACVEPVLHHECTEVG